MDIHVVRAGETVSSVAARYGVPAGILAGVNGIAPGLVDTKLTKVTTDNPKRREATIANIPLKRFGTPEDMAGAALFLAALAWHVLRHRANSKSARFSTKDAARF